MRIFAGIIILISISNADFNFTKKFNELKTLTSKSDCVKALEIATEIHWNYVNDNNVSITDTYNSTNYMKKICKEQ